MISGGIVTTLLVALTVLPVLGQASATADPQGIAVTVGVAIPLPLFGRNQNHRRPPA